jgi:hypothetical protein
MKGDTLKCPTCGKEFPDSTGKRKYCSSPCVPDKWANVPLRDHKCEKCGKVFQAKRKARWCSVACYPSSDFRNVGEMKPCERCGAQFRNYSGKGRFCSHSCSSKGRDLSRLHATPKTKTRKPRIPHVHNCHWCGREYLAKTAKSQFCDAECSVTYRAFHDLGVKICPGCQTEFTPKRWGVETCGNGACARRLRYVRNPPVSKTYTCQECGVDFVPKQASRKSFCSRPCAYAFKSAGKQLERRHSPKSNPSNNRKRARKNRCEREPYKRGEVYEACDWKCWLCGEDIDRQAIHPHPQSASIDHIWPMRWGGADSRWNVAAAHFRCNTLKRDKIVLVTHWLPRFLAVCRSGSETVKGYTGSKIC